MAKIKIINIVNQEYADTTRLDSLLHYNKDNFDNKVKCILIRWNVTEVGEMAGKRQLFTIS